MFVSATTEVLADTAVLYELRITWIPVQRFGAACDGIFRAAVPPFPQPLLISVPARNASLAEPCSAYQRSDSRRSSGNRVG